MKTKLYIFLHLPLLTLLALVLTGCQVNVPGTARDTERNVDNSAQEAPQQNDQTVTTVSDLMKETNANSDDIGLESNHPAAQIAAFSAPSETNGEVLVLFGQVIDVNSTPLADVTVEIWQTDVNGVYDHPQDPSTESRDTSFQFYGTTKTDADGWYAFRTLVPGQYEPRPRHIHFKVKHSGNTLLTSQFYFSDDIAEVQGEGMFQAVGDSGDLLLLQLVQGEGTLLAKGRIVVDTGIGSGENPLTPAQGEGPYYPVVDLATMDNDLVRLP